MSPEEESMRAHVASLSPATLDMAQDLAERRLEDIVETRANLAAEAQRLRARIAAMKDERESRR